MNIPAGFLLKKILGLAFMPLTICLLLFALGLVYIALRRSREALAPFVIGTVLLYACSLNTVAAFLVRPLERAYPALDLSSQKVRSLPVKWVVVLGSGHWTDRSIPPGAMLNEDALYRLTEGIRVANRFPGSVLILSGGKILDEQSNAQVMAAAAAGLGFDPSRMVLSDKALDTRDEALHIRKMVGKEAFVLVTTASHMVRAMKLFEKEGLSPIPAPTCYRDKGGPEYFLPFVDNIKTCHLAVHEYLGLAWAFVRGQVSLGSP